jgi:hypothetical protein
LERYCKKTGFSAQGEVCLLDEPSCGSW